MAENTYYTRTAAGWVKYMSAHFPCVLLTGARQVGKSTLLEEVRKSLSTSIWARQLLTSTHGVQDRLHSFPLHTHPDPLLISGNKQPQRSPGKQAEPSGQALVGK